MKFSVKIRDIHKIEKRVVSALMVWVMKARKKIKFICQKILAKDTFFIIGRRRGKRHYVPIRLFYDYLQVFSKAEILKGNVNDC